jgi:transcriptional regulator with XRE-family HTH domain
MFVAWSPASLIARTMKKSFALRRNALHAAIGRQLRDLREERRLTLEQVAHRTNLSVSLLSQIARGEPGVSVSSLFAIATVLDVHLADLFGDLLITADPHRGWGRSPNFARDAVLVSGTWVARAGWLRDDARAHPFADTR